MCKYIMCNRYYDPYVKVYYLVYQVYKSELLWIVKISEVFSDLKKSIRFFVSNIEKYFIISKKVRLSQVNLNIKQFTLFEIDPSCDILFETKIS